MSKNSKNVGDQIKAERASWTFDGDIASNFDSHVSKSVPGYTEGHEIIESLSDFFLTKDGAYVVDIGSSTGSLLNKLLFRHKNKKLNFIGIEPSKEMSKVAEKKISRNSQNSNISTNFYSADFLEHEIKNKVSIYISYYTMQFIHTSVRQNYIDKIYKTLDWGGALFLFEKIRAPDARFQDYMTQVYNDFKIRNGYSIEEVYKKTESIRGVLEPFSEAGNIDLFKRAGFKDFTTIYHNICFRGWLIVK
ncbi:MAG: hypothetical protein CBB97_14950 [Candidatus Endolissoclinum sp. TMED37]|nr:MAG: hypothetical protein CBB97_14950 [Candidatus Endolissoclinum sp. TMED37]